MTYKVRHLLDSVSYELGDDVSRMACYCVPVSTVQAIFERWEAALVTRADLVEGLDGVFQFHIEDGSDSGSWTLFAQPPVRVVAGGYGVDNPSAECILTIAGKDLRSIIEGSLNPQWAFLTGKIKLRGSTELALRLHHLFSTALAQGEIKQSSALEV